MSTGDLIISSHQIIEGEFYALPHEQVFQAREIEGISVKQRLLADHIEEAMGQSAETSHDNAPAEALFGEMNLFDQRKHRLILATRRLHLIPYPEPSLELVTIGSRVECVMNSDHFVIDIRGNLPITLPEDGEVESGSVSAPMPKALLGIKAGSLAVADIGGKLVDIDVVSIDQLAQRNFYENISTVSIED